MENASDKAKIDDAPLNRVLADVETAKRRATMALIVAREALQLSLSTPRIGAMLKEIDAELQRD